MYKFGKLHKTRKRPHARHRHNYGNNNKISLEKLVEDGNWIELL
jgi:hypothetical protein